MLFPCPEAVHKKYGQGGRCIKETEKEINHSIDVAITRQQEAQNKPQSDLEKFYSNIKRQSKVPLDPLFQDYIQQIMDDNIYWTQKFEDIKSNQQTMVDYEIVHSLIQTISNAAAEAPREYRQLSSSLPKMEEETTQKQITITVPNIFLFYN